MAELRRVGNYDVLDRIGRGGMGAVFKARQISMNRIVALKILPPDLAKQPTFIERFMREARASAKLNHPNIVNGIDVGSSKGLYYFAMEYIEGSSLKAVIDQEERIDEARAIEISRQISLALDHAHSHGILHRDIKPENILIQKDGSAKLCDLGLAHLATESDADKDLTQSGRAVGTPHYISPEQARGLDNLDATADLYSLGATLYHMVCGVTLFQGGTAVSIMSKHIAEKGVEPSEFGAELSEGLLKILAKLLTKDRADRYPSAKKLAQDLERIGNGDAPRYAELDSAKWPFKGRAPGAKSDSDMLKKQDGAARKNVASATVSVDKSERGVRAARRASRPDRSS
jgi:serine/threonine protein kinase